MSISYNFSKQYFIKPGNIIKISKNVYLMEYCPINQQFSILRINEEEIIENALKGLPFNYSDYRVNSWYRYELWHRYEYLHSLITIKGDFISMGNGCTYTVVEAYTLKQAIEKALDVLYTPIKREKQNDIPNI